MNDRLKDEAKEYVRALYLTHRNDDLEAWDKIIDVLWSQIDIMVAKHCEDQHELETEE